MIKTYKKLGQKGQIHIPKLFIEHYGIKPGDEVILEVTDQGILIKPISFAVSFRKAIEIHKKLQKNYKTNNAKLGDLKDSYLEEEFEE